MKGERRQEILRECFKLQEKSENFELEFQPGSKGYFKAESQYLADQERLKTLYEEYRDGVPIVPLSRCPFCNAEIHYSLDTYGLDGLWWSYDASIRPQYHKNTLCPHYLALSGAVLLSKPVEQAPIIVSPGPEVPFVLPRLLNNPLIKAVVSSIEVGIRQAYPIFYFTESKSEEFELFNTWGTNYYEWENANGELIWGQSPELTRHYDFQIESWIHQEKLLWISPGDKTLKLRSELEGCPYLNLPGRQERVYVQNGNVWV